MAGTWMSMWKVLVECVKNDTLNFLKKFQNNGHFIHNFRNQIITGCHYHFETTFSVDGTKDLTIVVNGRNVTVSPNNQVAVTQINCKNL
jgi:maltose phosphorylase